MDSVNFPADQTGYDMVTGDDGKLYLLSANTDGATLYCVENDTLQPVSTVLSGTMYNPKLAFSNGTPYLLWQDSQYFLHLNRWNSTSGVWQDCYTGTELAQYADIAADSSGVYVTYTTGSFPMFFTHSGLTIPPAPFPCWEMSLLTTPATWRLPLQTAALASATAT